MNTPVKFIPYGFYYFSNTHIKSAAIFAKEAEKIELQSQKTDYIIAGELERNSHTSYVVSSVIMSVAYLEGFINEIFVLLDYESTERYAESFIKSIDFNQRQQLSQLWHREVKKYRTLEKYDYLLNYIKNETLNRVSKIYQNVDILIKLRNYFIHYQPERIYDSERYIVKIGQKLKGKFPNNFTAPDHSPFFPYKCISYGCAIWGLNSVLDFTEVFAKKIGWEAFGSYTRDMVTNIISENLT